MLILGIDPGANTGVAHFLDGELAHLETIAPHQIDAQQAKQAGRPEGWHACGNVGMEASE